MRKVIRNACIAALGTVLTVVAISALILARPASAAETSSSSLHGGGLGMCRDAGLEAAAGTLGMSAEELSTELWGGKSLADLAEAAGVDLQSVQDAVQAACEQATRDAIEQAVTDGTLTREHANWLLEGLDQGFWGPGSEGSGFQLDGRGFRGAPLFGRTPFNNPHPATPGDGA